MTDSRRKGSVGFWLTVVATVIVFYVTSSGPGNWLILKGYVPSAIGLFVYAPLFWIVERCPEATQETFVHWLSLWHPREYEERLRMQIREALLDGAVTVMPDEVSPIVEANDGDPDSGEPGHSEKPL
jgi:hypothetical protein